MIKYPSIGQFRDVIKAIRLKHDFQGLDEYGHAIIEHRSPYPSLVFEGTVKIHGTNAGIAKIGGKLYAQGRSRVLTVEDDNAGFARFVSKLPDDVVEALPEGVVLFGEWCGKGIQKGCGIHQLEKRFIVFGARDLITSNWVTPALNLSLLNIYNIYGITQFPRNSIYIDFNHPECSKEMLELLTESVEKECPVAKAFGVSGVGEGIVWVSKDKQYRFKVKGEKHKVTKTKELAPVDIEKLATVEAFVEATVTNNRLAQGLSFIEDSGLDICMKNTGVFIKWVYTDIIKEEQDQLEGNGLCAKDVSKAVSVQARKYWFDKCS